VVHLDTRAPLPDETGTSSALIRGVIARLLDLGYAAGGFDAVVHSDVAPGSGLSSSAAFEVLVGVLVSRLFNGGSIPPAVLAAAGQFAENRYFGKPCGLMDQLTSATGGALHINFADPARPVTEQVAFDPEASGYILCVVETGGSHADLTGDYAAIPAEMRSVAGLFGLPDCRDLKRETLLADARRVRAAVGDRAFLRAKHFVDDNARVLRQVRALEAGDFEAFLRLVNESGESSALLLQNCWAPSSPAEQGVALALALTRDHLRNSGGGACRVHGGGFAGTIQAYIPAATMPGYLRAMEAVFGNGCVVPLAVRSAGAVAIETPALLSQ
jgi:galactokinase